MLKTKYDIGCIPLSEYPRPQLRRDSYLCLNGEWHLAKCKREEKTTELLLKITVPFSPETLSSGIGNGFTLGDDEKLVGLYLQLVHPVPYGLAAEVHVC